MSEEHFIRAEFILSKAGARKAAVIVSGCLTVGFYVNSASYFDSRMKTYVLVAYIVSWAVSTLIYLCKATGLSAHCNTPCLSFNNFEHFWTWISCLNYFSTSIALGSCFDVCDPGCNRSKIFCSCAKQLTALLLGFLTAILCVYESRNLSKYAVLGTAYGTSWRGIRQMFILVVGCVAYALLIEGSYICSLTALHWCTIGRTVTLGVWCTGWGVTCLFYLLQVTGCVSEKLSTNGQHRLDKAQYWWSSLSCFLYLAGVGLYAGLLNCTSFDGFQCRYRLTADVCGAATAILFAIDAYNLRKYRPVCCITYDNSMEL